MIDVGRLVSQHDARVRALSRSHSNGNGLKKFDGPRADAVSNDGLSTYRLSDPRDMARLRRLRHEDGCILSLDEDRRACVTHGVTIGWVVS